MQIPPRKNRKEQRFFDNKIYKLLQLENVFLHLKRCRGITTRYAKFLASFLAAVKIPYIALWAAICDDITSNQNHKKPPWRFS
ncbi:MAG: hypothetical protein RL497_2519 [Pseudomonadota bacterium]|jgi:transposase